MSVTGSVIQVWLGPSVCHLGSCWRHLPMCPRVKGSWGGWHPSLPSSDLLALTLRHQVSFSGTPLINVMWIKFWVCPHFTVFGVLSFSLMPSFALLMLHYNPTFWLDETPRLFFKQCCKSNVYAQPCFCLKMADISMKMELDKWL